MTFKFKNSAHVKMYKQGKIQDTIRKKYLLCVSEKKKIYIQKKIYPTVSFFNKRPKKSWKWAKPMNRCFIEDETQRTHKLNENMLNLNLISN